MDEPLNIEISKFQKSISATKSIATYQQGDQIVVQLWEGQTRLYHDILTHQEYLTFRDSVSEYGLPNYPPPKIYKEREVGGTNANGNTVGRVVGETARTELPSTSANPSPVTETEKEGLWEKASPWVHGSLDALGFIPGLGAIPDTANGVIYAIEGDLHSAGISLLAAIPFAGDALKGGVLINKGVKANSTARKSLQHSAPPSGPVLDGRKSRSIEIPNQPRTKKGGKSKGHGRLEVECFELPNGADEAEFMRQLKEQEDALNSMDAEKLVERRDAIHKAGGTEKIRDKPAQRKARKDYKKHRLQALRNQGKSRDEAKNIVELELNELAATHLLDIIAGGDPKKIGMGNSGINSSLGAQWRGRRANSLEIEARKMIENGLSKSKMHVKLKKCN